MPTQDLSEAPPEATSAGSTHVIERPSSRHIRGLDGYRGIAFLLVFARHFFYSRRLDSPLIADIKWFSFLGWVGVDLFFVLSGFLITGILLDTLPDAHYFRNFIMRRVLRIFPLYYGVLFLVLALTPLLHLQWHLGHLGYFLYVGNITAELHPELEMIQPGIMLVHFWSLALEEQFYLLWPLAVLLMSTNRRIIRLALALSALGLLLRAALLLMMPVGAASEWASALLPTRWDGLLYGAMAAALVRMLPMPQLVRAARWSMAVSGLLLVALFWHKDSNYVGLTKTLFEYPLLAIFFAGLLTLALNARSLAARFGSFVPLRVLGRYSYGLYVYHLIFFPLESPLLPYLQQRTGSVAVGGVLFLVAVLGITLALAVASYELYERHFLRLKRFYTYDRTRAAPAAAAIESA